VRSVEAAGAQEAEGHGAAGAYEGGEGVAVCFYGLATFRGILVWEMDFEKGGRRHDVGMYVRTLALYDTFSAGIEVEDEILRSEESETIDGGAG
jgi:hypothetical protein